MSFDLIFNIPFDMDITLRQIKYFLFQLLKRGKLLAVTSMLNILPFSIIPLS